MMERDAPAEAEKKPSEHGSQAVFPTSCVEKPAGQRRQDAWPAIGWYELTGQA